MRTCSPDGIGVDASRAHLMKFSHHYWPMDALKTWLEQNWDMWIESPPPWFTTRFIKRIIRVAPPEALPMSVLQGLAEKYSDDKNPDNWSSGSFASRESKGMRTIRNLNTDSRPGPSRDALVRRETKRRRLLASSQRKNHFLWAAALFCGYADLITTVLVAFAYLRMGTEGRIAAYLIFGVLAAHLLSEAIISLGTGQGSLAALVSLGGGKLLWSTWHVVENRPIGGGLSAISGLVVARCTHTVLNSLPQAVVQLILVIQRDPSEVSWLMLLSIVGCSMSIGYLVASTEFTVDMSTHFRVNHPSFTGVIPRRSTIRQLLIMGGYLFFIGGYLVGKLIALTALACASLPITVVWCTIEALALLLLRTVAEEGIWRFHLDGLSNAPASLLIHIILYIAMAMAPFPFIRAPGFVGPTPWACFVVYNLVINPVMLFVALNVGVASFGPSDIFWAALSVSTAISVLGLVSVWLSMNSERRHTFYRPLSLKQLLNDEWEKRTLTHMRDNTLAEGLDPSRAELLKISPRFWVPSEKLKTWLSAWSDWEEEKPAWFIDDENVLGYSFVQHITKHAPVEVLPRMLLFKLLRGAKKHGEEMELSPDLDSPELISLVKRRRYVRRGGLSTKVLPGE
eukprot:CAMPEP_0182570834 /NCGR_PEP_ID=MMETSP1324-20130603/11027_1 /TAXON_ID=236786 /ORGANISM="Florenciella sp., Strain RCC1587" /LENGTH=624 /DNA_ID=CAMNT_0024785269 /DNA_START=20 /DNA_END=1894 /DNA_ORIENTATION=+